jgi:sulfopyruvate decarboxylase subunit alpha
MAARKGCQEIVAALEAAGVTVIATVPDTWIGWLIAEARSSSRLRVVDAASEEDAVAIACGATLAGARAAVAIQNAGLLNCGTVIGSLVHLFQVPCFLLVSYRGDERDPIYYHAPKGRATEPTLDAWNIRYARASGAERVGDEVKRGVALAYEARVPFALLVSGEDLG